MATTEVRTGTVPKQALLLSLLSLSVPVAASAMMPDWTSGDVGVLVWLLALVPGLLLSYYRGWQGATLALAGGMAALSIAQVLLLLVHATAPRPQILFGVVVVLTAVSLGSGLLSHHFHRTLDRAERMALTDAGTGMPNRRHAILELEKAFAAAQRGADLAVVLFDLDHFKRVNDRHGHAEGDRVLVRFADILQAVTRAMHVTARFGGEEFVAVLRGVGSGGARVYAERVRQRLAELALPCGPITVSAGVAAYEPGMAAPDVLLAAADQALYRAKDAGRDRVVVLDRVGRRAEVPPRPPEHEEEEVPAGRGELVLVVDDDVDALRSVARALRRFGYTVLESPSPTRAVEIVRGLDDPPEVVLTDIVMPEMGGFRLVEILEEIQDEVRVVYMSGYSQEDVDWGGVPGAVRDYLSKPISIYTLARRIRWILDQPARTRRLAAKTEGDESTPLTAPPQEAASQALDDGRIGTEARILVLHADEHGGDMIARTLRDRGFKTVQLVDGIPSLLDGLPHMRAEILLLDLDLPAEGLEDLVDRLVKHAASAPALLLLVGQRNHNLRNRCTELPLVDFVNKPFTNLELATRLTNLARTRAYERWIGSAEDQIRSRIAARSAELEEAREEVLRRLAWAAEYRDDVTGRHAERVGVLSGLIARELGWSPPRKALLEKAAPLHDLGKIAVPDAILRKAGGLTPAERKLMQNHTTIGAELLSGSRNPVLHAAEQIALTHHEWWDGAGYPQGIAGESIPEAGRIVAVADVFDSLTNNRPYRDAISTEAALDMIRSSSGVQFDPNVVRAFDRVVEAGHMQEAMDLEVVARPDLR
jgi:putative two-component system response regulator